LELSHETTYEKVTEALLLKDQKGLIPHNEAFNIRVNVNGHEIEVRGIIIDGELNYGTFFIPE
jgi:hypothetical protein